MERSKSYSLESRTVSFSKEIIKFCKEMKLNAISSPLINQLVRAGTSIGANYYEANGASSKRDFKNKIHICKKEAQETLYWLTLIDEMVPENERAVLKNLLCEVDELCKIFGKIISTMNRADE